MGAGIDMFVNGLELEGKEAARLKIKLRRIYDVRELAEEAQETAPKTFRWVG